MPKSYLSSEPGARRAADHRFDPYAQASSRLAALSRIGHPVDKVELIVLGGTWTSYPEDYQIWFVTRCFEAINDFEVGAAAPRPAPSSAFAFEAIATAVDGRRTDGEAPTTGS